MAVRRPINLDHANERNWKAAALVLSLAVSAYLMSVAIASPDHWWLGWITLLPLFQAMRVLTPATAFCAGTFWGSCLLCFVLMGDARIAGNAQGLAFAVLSLCLVPGGYACFGARLTRHIGFSPYLLALGWVAVEFAVQPLGLRHGLLAATQGDGAAVGFIGSLIGFIGNVAGYVVVAFLVAYVNAALLSVLSEVHASISQPRLVTGASGTQRRVLLQDLPSYLSHLFRPARPRAPPF